MNRPEMIAVQKQLIDKLKSSIDSGIPTADRAALCTDIKTLAEAIAVTKETTSVTGFAERIAANG